MSDSLQPHGLQPTSLLRPRDFPGKSTGVGCHCLLQEIFPTQGLNPGLPHCRQTLYHLSHQGRSKIREKLKKRFYYCSRDTEEKLLRLQVQMSNYGKMKDGQKLRHNRWQQQKGKPVRQLLIIQIYKRLQTTNSSLELSMCSILSALCRQATSEI